MIVVVDYGVGNLGSIRNMFRADDNVAEISADPAKIEQATHLVLPGVGSFGHGMRQLKSSGLVDVVTAKARSGTPLLGICLGAQLLMEGSEEAGESGLGLIPGRVVRFRFPPASRFRVPHVGWADVEPKGPLFRSWVTEPSRFYFVHSYHIVCKLEHHVAATSVYSSAFVAAVEKGSMIGVQFHPEKSHRFGRNLLRRFALLK